jgi:hypothetical protein
VNGEPRGRAAREREQLQALALANAVRLAIADVRAEVKSGSLSVRGALDDERAAHMTVFQLLAAQHRWGPYRTATALEFVKLPERKRVLELTERQRELVVAVAAGRSWQELKELISHGFPGF